MLMVGMVVAEAGVFVVVFGGGELVFVPWFSS